MKVKNEWMKNMGNWPASADLHIGKNGIQDTLDFEVLLLGRMTYD
jgi:hypothetical protein